MLELSDIAALRRRNERIKEASLIGVADACSPSIRDMLVCAGDELTRVGLFDAENLRNLFIRVVESFAQHVGGAFRRREPFEQHEDRELQRLATLGAQCWIGAGIDRFGKPLPDGEMRLSQVLDDVEDGLGREGEAARLSFPADALFVAMTRHNAPRCPVNGS